MIGGDAKMRKLKLLWTQVLPAAEAAMRTPVTKKPYLCAYWYTVYMLDGLSSNKFTAFGGNSVLGQLLSIGALSCWEMKPNCRTDLRSSLSG